MKIVLMIMLATVTIPVMAQATTAKEKAMKVIQYEAQKATQGPEAYFTGKVTVESNFASEEANSYSGAMVKFDAGARTAWHTHPLGQTLIIISGKGLIQKQGEPIQDMGPGDVVWIPAEVKYWHGAAPNSAMSHIAISEPEDGKVVEWMEHVSDEQYLER